MTLPLDPSPSLPAAVASTQLDRLDRRSPWLITRLLPLMRLINRFYFRLQADGFDRLPSGPALYVGNHNGGIAGPDLCCTLASLWAARGPDAPLHMLAHDFAMRQFRPLGAVLSRLGAIRASPDNALHALRSGAQVLVYPGGDVDAYRHSRRRDEVVLGTRTGFVRLAQAAGVPIVPIVAHGAHRSAYIFTEGQALARRIGLKRWGRLERFPVALALPWIIAPGPWLPYLPLPFKVRLRVLDPIDADPDADPAEIREHVRTTMQAALDVMAHRAPRPS